ncbi:hypothetical protein BUALT_Bualt10G0004300 [Buddleja alternifolia]|uniref:Uncharacterized protein n=1 Tax=Buddleja alternifolia TaxID=168488 RepID=A0AAV6X5U1_9LAMI|nr:hypothetical protein BUALT_Bualt10G0004300 [Buddleja alternifolia]
MMKELDCAYNETMKMIEATEDAFQLVVKNDPNVQLMRYKTWPHYPKWIDIFGKDRATGEVAEDLMEAVNDLFENQDKQQEDKLAEDLNG